MHHLVNVEHNSIVVHLTRVRVLSSAVYQMQLVGLMVIWDDSEE
jgi:hypothetical protein